MKLRNGFVNNPDVLVMFIIVMYIYYIYIYVQQLLIY